MFGLCCRRSGSFSLPGSAEEDADPAAHADRAAAEPDRAAAEPDRAAADVFPAADASTSRPTGSTEWLDTELGVPPGRRRDRLPEHSASIPSVNLWSLIKDWIGKDIHKLTLPHAPQRAPHRPAAACGGLRVLRAAGRGELVCISDVPKQAFCMPAMSCKSWALDAMTCIHYCGAPLRARCMHASSGGPMAACAGGQDAGAEPGAAAAGDGVCDQHVQHHQARAEALQEPAELHLRAGLPREGPPHDRREGGLRPDFTFLSAPQFSVDCL